MSIGIWSSIIIYHSLLFIYALKKTTFSIVCHIGAQKIISAWNILEFNEPFKINTLLSGSKNSLNIYEIKYIVLFHEKE